ncbi:Cofactor-APC complex of cell division cycle 20-like protein 1 [Paramicrosporidium saccamoebae]|uniref:Cofactor-APC complex of cell division cycle 20-like protein 1 n=1 Tax=Paramicrosporidium saccamoebae TaxID=1246581 RepID=A0A2H9TLB0_9FUNG|nr:Cofactor-APC complex of cell division cycle 20-like protein 1 [Paramicrosporidium saccamoebae]
MSASRNDRDWLVMLSRKSAEHAYMCILPGTGDAVEHAHICLLEGTAEYAATATKAVAHEYCTGAQAWVVERFGKFSRILEPGLAILLPVVDQIKYVKTLKEVAVEVPTQSAITQDNVALSIDGVLYYRVTEPYKSCYGVEDADFAITQLAQTTMRSEIGKLTLDRTLAERNLLNVSIVEAINEAAVHWGIRCLRYEIRTIPVGSNV